MKPGFASLTITGLVLFCMACTNDSPCPTKVMHQVDFSKVHIDDAFWNPRLENNALQTIPVCIDQIENRTGRIRNFENAASGEGGHSGIFFDDSDVYKAVEGFAYSLVNHPDTALEHKTDEWIAKFAAAQQPDGYLNTYYTLAQPDGRWTDTDKHEMYCAGHMLEAAIAYYRATGKREMLDVATRMVDHMMSLFGPGKRDWLPGHEEIELALCKLFGLTGEEKYLDFAYWLLEERGHGNGHYADGPWVPGYYQDLMPVRDLRTISGHAVRAMYLFCGMADVASYRSDTGYMEALDSLWEDVVGRQMYVTGGIGVSYCTEGFSEPFDLPNDKAYCETCASIGMVLWNHRMNELKGDARYADVLERALYNGVLAGISQSGDRFFYVNPLESDGNHHRQAWYGCACCPSNVCRFIPSIGNYIYGTSNDGSLWVNQYIGSSTSFSIGRNKVDVQLTSQLPVEGRVILTFATALKGSLRLRIPTWTTRFEVSVNGVANNYAVERGYAVVDCEWRKGDVVSIDMDMPVMLLKADARVKADEGKVAVQRGPFVYCAEAIDNADCYDAIVVDDSTSWKCSADPMLGAIQKLTAVRDGQTATLIPYYCWDNREPSLMKVWFDLPDPSRMPSCAVLYNRR